MAKKPTMKSDGNDPVTKKEFNKRNDTVDARFDAVDARFNAVDARFDAVDARFDKVEMALQNQAKTLLDHSKKFEELDAKIDTLATKADYEKVINILDVVVKKIEDFGNKAIVNTHRINETEIEISAIKKRVDTLESSIGK